MEAKGIRIPRARPRRCPLSSEKSCLVEPEATREDVTRPADTSRGVDGVNTVGDLSRTPLMIPQPFGADGGRNRHRVHDIGEQHGDLFVFGGIGRHSDWGTALVDWGTALVAELCIRPHFG